MKNTKRLAILAFAIMLVFTGMIPCACSEENVTTEEAFSDWNPDSPASIKDKIAAIDGVLSIEAVGNNQSDWLPERYIVMVEQQIDWSDPDAGTFPQRVEVGIHPGAEVNILETNGYMFLDGELTADSQPELCLLLEANHIRAEHRFSGESFPEGMNNDSTEGWEYLTTENESGDYHHIYEIMSQVLDGQWVCYGRSRGGRACMDYARHYPNDMKGYISYVGVNCNGLNDPRIMDYLNKTIGDNAFGKEEAARRRGVIEDFLVECVKCRDQMENLLWEAMGDGGYSFPDWVSKERLFDLSLLEFQSGFWQSDGDIQEIEKALALSDDGTEENTSEKTDALFTLLLQYGDPSSYSHESFGFSYYAGALINEGYYDLDFSFLRTSLKKAGLEDRLAVRPEDEKDLLKNVALDECQKDVFIFVPGNYEALADFAQTTDLKIVFIGGDLDPWSAVYVDGGGNPNFRSYIFTRKSHRTQIADFDQQTQDEIVNSIKSWLQ